MSVELVTFDCAGTLLQTDWQIDRFAETCAAHIGLAVPEGAGKLYLRQYAARLPEFLEVNRTRDPGQGDAFYDSIAEHWLMEIGHPASYAPRLRVAADELLLGPRSVAFRVFEDVLPTLDRLRNDGIRLAVISNWDYSLRRVLRSFGLDGYFERIFASLEEGVEKPARALFDHCLAELSVSPTVCLHVGDDPIDDVQGALGAGLHAALIDREKPSEVPRRIASLEQLPEVLRSIG